MNTKHPTARAVRAFSGLSCVLLGIPLAAAPLDGARPPEAQRYVSAHVGLNNPSSWTARSGAADAGLSLDRGLHLGLALGRRIGPARYEVEYQHGRLDIERAHSGAVAEPVDASGSYDVLTVNALRALHAGRSITVFGGVGAGVARVGLPHMSLAKGCRCLPEAERTGLAWQARIGAEHRAGMSGQVFAQLGYLRLPGPGSDAQRAIRYRSRGFGVLSAGYRHAF